MFKPIKYFLNPYFPTKTKKKLLKLRETETEKIFLLARSNHSSHYLCYNVVGFEKMWEYLLSRVGVCFGTIEGLGVEYSGYSRYKLHPFESVVGPSSAIREEIREMCQEAGYFSLKDFLDVFIKHMDRI